MEGMAWWAPSGWLGQLRVCGKLSGSPAAIKRASWGNSSFGLTRTQELKEKAASERQNSVSLGAEQARAGFIKHEVMRKRFYRDPGSLRRKEVEDHRQSRLVHTCALPGQVSLSSAVWHPPWRLIPSPPPSSPLFLKHESGTYWRMPHIFLSTLSRHTEWLAVHGWEIPTVRKF